MGRSSVESLVFKSCDKNISQTPSDDVGDVKLSNDNTDIVDKLR